MDNQKSNRGESRPVTSVNHTVENLFYGVPPSAPPRQPLQDEAKWKHIMEQAKTENIEQLLKLQAHVAFI